jgi:hypothetical protein
MATTSPDPDLPEIIEPERVAELFDAATEILDLVISTGDPVLGLHVDACKLADELLFAHEAMHEAHLALGNDKRADDEARLVHSARQLKAWHLDKLDREIDRRLHLNADT